MEAWKDFYGILNVHERADRDAIEAMYKSLCKKFHPDLNHSPDAEGRMKEINIAWEVLRDEQKRKVYHEKWLRHMGKNSVPRANAAGAEPVYTPGAWRVGGQWGGRSRAAREAATEEIAKAAVCNYFEHISLGNYTDAYDLLCEEDRRNIPLDSFTIWQTSVSAKYQIEKFNVLSCKSYSEFPIGDCRCPAKRFTMEIDERNLATGEWSHYTLIKFLIEQDGKWSVYLGYRNLDYVIEQVSLLSGTLPESMRRMVDLSCGLPNRLGFLEKSKAEAYRYERYNRDCSVAVATVVPLKEVDDGVRERIFVQSGCAFRAAVRLIDIVGSLGSGRFALLLAECDIHQARNAVRRIGRRVEQEIFACFDSKINIKWKTSAYTGGDMGANLSSCEK